jgi:hypothetical protein
MCTRSRVCLGAAVSALFLASSSPCASAYSGVIAFGDSLSDRGNTFEEMGYGWFIQNFTGYSATYYNSAYNSYDIPAHGRFANGPTWVEYLEGNLRSNTVGSTPVDLGANPGTNTSTRNFAWGGSTTGDATIVRIIETTQQDDLAAHAVELRHLRTQRPNRGIPPDVNRERLGKTPRVTLGGVILFDRHDHRLRGIGLEKVGDALQNVREIELLIHRTMMDDKGVTDVAATDIEKADPGLQLLLDGQVLALRRSGNGFNQCPGVVGSGNRQFMKKLFSIDRCHPVVARGRQAGTRAKRKKTGHQ